MKRLLLVVAMVVVGVWAGPVANQAQAQGPVPTSSGCDFLNDPFFDGVYTSMSLSILEFQAGQVVTISASDPIGGATLFDLIVEDGTHRTKEIPGTVSYTFTMDGLSFVRWGTDTGAASFNVSCTRGQKPMGGGCDLGIDLSGDAVVGTFLFDTALQGTPGDNSPYVVDAGQTAWVLGMDESGMYYKIVWACGYYWVPVGSMGPNFDEVWNGYPLPTTVVK
jgi:hypothetical protein